MTTENTYIVIFLALIIFIIYLIFQVFRLKKRIDVFFKKGETDLEEILKNQLGKTEDQEKDIKKIFDEISELDKISKKSFQKIGIVRFNPFKDAGGDQSFSIALLESNNSGVVITSLYGREGNRVYAKPIINGGSEYTLAEEEKEALNKAKES